MQAGRRDRKISIEKSTSTRNEYGEVIQGWELFAEAFANRRDQTSREIFQYDQLTNLNVVAFTLLFIDGLNTTMRLKCEGKIYNIRGIQEVKRRRELRIIAEDSGEIYG
jgi:SPP1 family predicted phage head-tail adaptor